MSDDNHLIQSGKDGNYTVVLPCSQQHFKEFVSGLLGKPQTIERRFFGWYEISKNDLINIYHLVDQRVFQQNGGTLLQFSVKIVYQDQSSVLINSLQDFEVYAEIRPLISVSAHLSWTYLIQFQDKQYPEKQQIELSYITGLSEMDLRNFEIDSEEDVIGSLPSKSSENGEFRLRINHTARSWGVDIEALISAHIRTLRKAENSFLSRIWRNDDKIGLSAGFLFFMGSLIGSYFLMTSFGEMQQAAASDVLKLGISAPDMDKKIGFAINTLLAGVWPRFTLGIVAYVIISLVAAVFIGVWVAIMASNKPISVLLLTKKSNPNYS
jgi:hypothetical protein